ncbi:Ig domain-containing protein [Methylococcus mesophilus]|uniref:Ig domain-containing protein n=1 Tax=Methylococcus mesophilus TaxID=2993564 RepID=UPI00224A6069|nr:Ig domain-containing protein [Methylococcus mesophilus]UZR28777.1 Ig domain-containing protein [Methylococcus mesophilus]
MATTRTAAARLLSVSLSLILLAAFLPEAALAAAKLKIAKATWSDTTGMLVVKGSAKNASGSIEIYDLSGRLLGSSQGPAFVLKLDRGSLAAVPCGVRVQAGDTEAVKAVKGSPADCKKAPACQILTPTQEIHVSANTDVSFAGSASLNDPEAQPLKLEWDFAGGSMGEPMPNTHPTAYKRPDGQNTTVQFVRDNASYKVRFTAWDKKNRYCEDSVMVHVGNPPTNLPDVSAMVKQAQDSAPKPGSQLAGNKGEVVVLPFPYVTFQNATDARFTPDLHSAAPLGPFTSLNAVVYRKDRLPPQLTGQEVQLRYSASVNSDDPVGAGSVNATSQNWPLNSDIGKSAPLVGASIAKTDQWEILVRPPSDVLHPVYTSKNWFARLTGPESVIGPDEGAVVGKPFYGAAANYFWGGTAPTPFADDHGRYMPGRDQPYAANAPQDFSTYLESQRFHTARNIPVADIDDAGRVNPFPLMRAEAVDKSSGQPLAAADAVVAVGKDFHCRECHAKGKIAANDQLDWSRYQQAFHSSWEYSYCGTSSCETFAPPVFYEAVDRNGQPSQDLYDQEYAAIKNASALHDWYDDLYLVSLFNGPQFSGAYIGDAPSSCNNCHQSLLQAEVAAQDVNNGFGQRYGEEDFWPRYSPTMHNFHALLQLDPSDPDKILRGADGRPLRWDPSKGSNPNTLFPTVDAQGNALPQEQSCLHCHAGHRDQLYRDRMYTAGVTCYDCHGDMLAVGQAYDKPKAGPEGFTTRMEWYEQPDCGSCHTGDANRGKDGANGFFSAGVMKRAFDNGDRAAISRVPSSQRFAVQQGKATDVYYTNWLDTANTHGKRSSVLSLSAPLYRNSKDTHGDVACAACHGAAHEVWPNRDPKANDNVTAMQLQGHTGTVLECNVCHTADSFAKLEDLDGGQYSGDAKPGILGGPHNTHPVDDPYWWKEAPGDTANADGTTYGGLHNNYAKLSGANGEDQCAACHGNDHKGTRLSKTPVDRVFDFRGFNAKKLKKAGFKAKVIKVPAGTEIGCDTCHNIETSCIGAPAGSQCGVASATVPGSANHDPVITSDPGLTTAVMGQPYSYQVAANDPDGDPLSYSLGLKPGSMTISEQGLVTTDWPVETFGGHRQPPFTFPYTVTVKDGKGGYATQTVTMTLRCPDGQHWEFGTAGGGSGEHDHGPTTRGSCVADTGVTITSQPPMGVTEGAVYNYQVSATSNKGLPLTYSLVSPFKGPAGMSIDPNTGLLTWQAGTYRTPTAARSYSFTVRADDGQGGSATQTVVGRVCRLPKTWHSDHGMCM